MICPQCGKEFADDLSCCPQCGAEIKSVDTNKSEKTSSECCTCCCSAGNGHLNEGVTPKKRRPKNRLKIAIALILILAGIAAVAYYNYSRTPEMEALIPESSPMFISSDASWWWEAAEDVRLVPDVQDGMQKIEKEIGLSFEKDLTPWIGKMVFVLLDVKQYSNKSAIIAEIRDKDAFKRCLDKLSARAEKDTGNKWKEISYRGVKMRRMDISGPTSPVTVAVVKGYVVCGIGPDSAQDVIDVLQGREPSIKSNPIWLNAFDALPKDTVVRIAYNAGAFIEKASKMDPTGSIKVPESAKNLIVCAFTEGDGSLRMDTVTVAESDAAKKALREAKANMGSIDGRSLKELPSGAFAAVVMSNPGYMVDNLKKSLLDMIGNQQARQMAEMGLMQAQPVFDAFHRCTGECAAGFTYRNGDGFGAVVVSETKDKASSKASASELTSFIANNGLKVAPKASLAVFTDAKIDEQNLHILPCLGTRDKWLVFGTHPKWITGSERTDLKLPDDLGDVQFAGVGNFKFFPSMLKWLESQDKINPRDADVISFIRRLKLENATWKAWSTIDADKGVGRSVMILEGWDWRQGLENAISAMQEAPKKKTEGSVVN